MPDVSASDSWTFKRCPFQTAASLPASSSKEDCGRKATLNIYMVRKKGLVVWERTISYSLYTVHKTKPTQNPCWHWRPPCQHSTPILDFQWQPRPSNSAAPELVFSKWCKCGRISVCLDRFLLDLGILLCVPIFYLFQNAPFHLSNK